jgi:hypothetical protein
MNSEFVKTPFGRPSLTHPTGQARAGRPLIVYCRVGFLTRFGRPHLGGVGRLGGGAADAGTGRAAAGGSVAAAALFAGGEFKHQAGLRGD